MPTFRSWSTLVGAWLACTCTAPLAQTAAQWQARQVEASRQSERIMRDADKRKGLLAQYLVMRYAFEGNKDPAFRLIFGQYVSWYQTFIGDYPDASASFSIKQLPQAGDRPSPLSNPRYHARPALEAIPELARNYRAVFFNEAHNVPLTRTLTVQLLSKLRAEGFNYFAAETLYQSDTGLQSRGYPIKGSGFYTEEPIYAEMVRTALKLGFKVVAYEALSDATGDAREAEQARNIYREVFKKNPTARLVVNAGYAHIQESGSFLGGSTMAEHLHQLSGIDPLTVEQTVLFPHQSADDDYPYYAPVMQQLKPDVPIVFVDNSGKPWALREGYDVSVFFPPQKFRRGRPTWLGLDGLREPYFVSGERCDRTFPCLIEARYADEGADAIPADRTVLDPVPLGASTIQRVSNGLIMPVSDLYLRPGKYRLSYSDSNSRPLYQREITVRKADADVSAADPDTSGQQDLAPGSPRPCAPTGSMAVTFQDSAADCPVR